ncbi:hypothetical protein J7L84_00605 [Candidatus Bipolaricaulota bacterium]|nr:hypothetical protein [Candidatus Bipolaricaulota bacterium]
MRRPEAAAARACPRCGGPLRQVLVNRYGKSGWVCVRCGLYVPDWLARIAGRAGVAEPQLPRQDHGR